MKSSSSVASSDATSSRVASTGDIHPQPSSLFSFPWNQVAQQQSRHALGATGKNPSLSYTSFSVMESLRDWSTSGSGGTGSGTGSGHYDLNQDTELLATLTNLVASGKTVTEDVVVEYQLTQFPAYGTAAAANKFNTDEKDDDEDDDYGEYESYRDDGTDGTMRRRKTRHNASAMPNTTDDNGTSSSSAYSHWLLSPWALLGGSPNAAATAATTANGDNDPSDIHAATTTNHTGAAVTLSPSDNAAILDAAGWDAREQFLWKQHSNNTTAPLSSSSSRAIATAATTHTSAITATPTADTLRAPLPSPHGMPLLLEPQQTIHSSRDNDVGTCQRVDSDQRTSEQDSLPPLCHACHTPFTVFRRRHHCRLCRHVYCNACSAYFVPSTAMSTESTLNHAQGSSDATRTAAIAPSTATSSIRVCQQCHDHVMVSLSTAPTAVSFAAEQEHDKDGWLLHSRSSQPRMTNMANAISVDTTSPLVLQFATRGGGGGATSPLVQEQIRRLASDQLAAIAATTSQSSINPTSSIQRSLSTVAETIHRGKRQSSVPTTAVGAGPSSSRIGEAVDSSNLIQDGNTHMEQMSLQHLQLMARELLRQHAPLIWKESCGEHQALSPVNNAKLATTSQPSTAMPLSDNQTIQSWIDALLVLAMRCCSTVNPNVKKGDLLDIRPYIKVKVVPGGTVQDCAYLSGVMFRKTVSHKRMVKELLDPRIMLLSGGIDFARSEQRIASLETLFEQEDKYMEILVGKILKFQPDVLLVGRSVNRNAQELLLQVGVVLVQHVKSNLLNRISRQTGATVVSNIDHALNQSPGSTSLSSPSSAVVLGTCRRFRLVAFRDNEVWKDGAVPTSATANQDDDDDDLSRPDRSKEASTKQTIPQPLRSIEALLSDQALSNHERQDALAAKRLGQGVIDGCDAVKAGLASRGVAHTYTLLEGCPKHLGCTVVLRGANKAALKQIKAVFRFLAMSAYNLRLETTYLQERGARLRPDFKVLPPHAFSSSLAVDYGKPPDGRKVRPWNGGNTESSTLPRLDPAELSAFDHQSILMTSVWMTEKTQCCPAEVKGICYYSLQDVALGQFLRDSCFNLSLKCQNPNCKKSVLDHSLSFVHNDGLINITVEEMDEPLRPPGPPKDDDDDDASDGEATDQPIATWTYCQHCRKIATPLTYISDLTWKFSFGKFLEVFFYNRDACLNSPAHGCACNLQSHATLFFGCEKLAARFTYERITPRGVFVRRSLPLDIDFHRKEAMRRLDFISVESSNLFVNFDKHIEKISREARSLFNSAMNRPEHLQTVLSELNHIGSEVDHAAKVLQEKIASVTENCRRNTDGSLNGALFRFPLFARRYLFNLTTAWNEKLSATGQAISAMKRIAASSSHLHDGAMGPNVSASISDPLNEELSEGMKRLRQLIDHYASYNVTDITQVLPSLPGGNEVQAAADAEYDEDFDDPDTSIDFADGIDADVVASRRRLQSSKAGQTPVERPRSLGQKPTKTLGTRRAASDATRNSLDSNQLSNVPPKPTPGGAVKSAITRFFNRGGRDYDQYVVDLGKFADGRPRLAPGVNGIVVPVLDEQLSTIIAYSLSSTEYAKQFKHFLKEGGGGVIPESGELPTEAERRIWPKPDLDAGVGYGDTVPNPPSTRPTSQTPLSSAAQGNPAVQQPSNSMDESKLIERQMLNRNKSHVKHTFRDVDEKGQVICKFVCTTYWATQFHAVRQSFLSGKPESSAAADGAAAAASAATTSGAAATASANQDVEQSYIESLLSAYSWAASGGKSGASFAKTADGRFVIKCISRTELQMFLDCARAYFEYLCKAFFHGLPTVLCKIVGVYQIGVHNRETGKRSMEQVAVMQNIFYNKKISKTFDLKGSLRGRFAAQVVARNSNSNGHKDDLQQQQQQHNQHGREGERERSSSSRHDNWQDDDGASRQSSANSLVDDAMSSDGKSANNGSGARQRQAPTPSGGSAAAAAASPTNTTTSSSSSSPSTLLDGDFLEFTLGRPMPLTDRAKAVFQMSILNDTLFLSIINVLDYSILVGFDEENMELVVGIIDFMRQYDILKQMERVGKSLPMVVGSEAPTIIQPPLYKARFTNAMERYFMTVPSKWTTI